MNIIKKIFDSFEERIARKKSIEFKQAFTEFSRSLILIVDLDQLKDNVITRIREIVKVDTILMFLFNPDVNKFQLSEKRGWDDKEDDQLYFITDDPLIKWFAVNQTYLIISEEPEIFSFFAEHEQKILEETNINFIFPLLAMNRIIGLICIGPKSSNESINDYEIELLKIFLGQAALAFENAYLYRQQKERFRKMYRADRLATLGQLAAGAAHEIRNPLTSIRSTIQYFKKDFKDQTKAKMFDGIIEEVDRINKIIEGLLSFSKPTKPEIEQVDLEKLLNQTFNLVSTTTDKRKIEMNLSFNVDEKFIRADPSQLKQVFLNLIMNSIEAMKDGGIINIVTELKRRVIQLIPESRYSFYISFQDTGEGIPRENLEHLFDPFFTTKKDGTGLGLSICYSIIHQHQGDIEIESFTKDEKPENHGTKVTVTLPILK